MTKKLSAPGGAVVATLVGLGLVVGSVPGCGGAPPRAAAPSDASVSEAAADGAPADDTRVDSGGAAAGLKPATVDDAAAQFESAEASLDALLAAAAADGLVDEDGGPPGDDAAADALPEAADGTPGRRAPAPPPPAAPAPQGMRDDGGRAGCPRACRALGSMKRSAARLCALTGRDDPRCVNVEERYARARARVQTRCPRCVP
ncbi:MAG: hypothetical protein AAF928_05470 [Myxococcota bacterium]